MFLEQRDFVLSGQIRSPVVMSIPHEGLRGHELEAYYAVRPEGVRGSEKYLSAILADANSPKPLASFVRGLLPRSLCDYNRPLLGVSDPALADRELLNAYEAYHRRIKELIEAGLNQWGRVYLIDIHGFSAERSRISDDLVLGSCGRTTTPCGLDERALIFFSKAGYRVRLAAANEKFSGGYTVASYGKGPVSALQIEITSRLRTDSSLAEGKRLAAAFRRFFETLAT